LRGVISKVRPVLKNSVPTEPTSHSARSGPDAVSTSLDRLQALWSDTVGDALAEHSTATGFRSGTLLVIVDAAPLAHELGFARTELVEALVGQGLRGLHNIRFKVG